MSKREEVWSCFTRLFNTPDGQRVLEDLERQFKENTKPIESNLMYHSLGERSVMEYINFNIKRGKRNDK